MESCKFVKSLKMTCANFQLKQMINAPTRCPGNSSTVLDLCMANIWKTLCGVAEYNLSDHYPVFLV